MRLSCKRLRCSIRDGDTAAAADDDDDVLAHAPLCVSHLEMCPICTIRF